MNIKHLLICNNLKLHKQDKLNHTEENADFID